MIIKDQDFIIEKITDSEFYNLSFNITVNKDTDKERSEFKIISYGIPFHSCIEKIVDYRMRNIDKELTVKEYLELYKKEVIKIGNLID